MVHTCGEQGTSFILGPNTALKIALEHQTVRGAKHSERTPRSAELKSLETRWGCQQGASCTEHVHGDECEQHCRGFHGDCSEFELTTFYLNVVYSGFGSKYILRFCLEVVYHLPWSYILRATEGDEGRGYVSPPLYLSLVDTDCRSCVQRVVPPSFSRMLDSQPPFLTPRQRGTVRQRGLVPASSFQPRSSCPHPPTPAQPRW